MVGRRLDSGKAEICTVTRLKNNKIKIKEWVKVNF